MKHYFNFKNSDYTNSIKGWKQYMKENNISELEVVLAKRDLDSSYMFCNYFIEASEKGYCGKICDGYVPKNGKNGICKHSRHCYEETEIKKIIKL